MAREVEVFQLTPEVGKCYEHVEATRSEPLGYKFQHRYFTTNKPGYVGKFIRQERYGRSDVRDYFDDEGKQNYVDYSPEGYTCYNEVACRVPEPGLQGGKRKKTRGGKRNTRRLHKKLKKTRGRR